MVKYFCDYCNAYLPSHSPFARKEHQRGKPHRANYRAYYQQFYRQWCVEQQLKQYHQQLVQQLAYISHKSAEDISAADSAISEEVKGTKRTFVEMNSSSSNEKQAKAVKPSK